MDSEATKTRFIILDSGTGTPSTASAQIAWLQKTTGNAPEGWHFIVFVHKIFGPGPGGAFNAPSTWEMSPFATDVCAVLDAVNAAARDAVKVTENASGKVAGNAIANAAGGKKVEAIFGGHCHIDYNGQTDGGIPIVMIDCDTRLSVSENLQEAGTIGEQCLDIVTVNYAAGEIHCARIGRGKSRTIAY